MKVQPSNRVLKRLLLAVLLGGFGCVLVSVKQKSQQHATLRYDLRTKTQSFQKWILPHTLLFQQTDRKQKQTKQTKNWTKGDNARKANDFRLLKTQSEQNRLGNFIQDLEWDIEEKQRDRRNDRFLYSNKVTESQPHENNLAKDTLVVNTMTITQNASNGKMKSEVLTKANGKVKTKTSDNGNQRHSNGMKNVTECVTVKGREESAVDIAKTVVVSPPDDHLPQNEAFFRLQSSVVTRVEPVWRVQPAPCPATLPRGRALLLVAIPSVGSHAHMRDAIRSTWANLTCLTAAEVSSSCANGQDERRKSHDQMSKMDPYVQDKQQRRDVTTTVKVVFFLGQQGDIAKPILQEAAQHKDIAVADFIDTYANLSLKMASVLQWVNTSCPAVDYVIKVDEDTVVDLVLLLNVLYKLARTGVATGPFVLGRRHQQAAPRVLRSGRWSASPQQYPLKYYPGYVFGHSYVVSGQAIPLLRHASQHLPLVANEDAYVTGVLAKAGGVTRLTTGRMAWQWDQDDCLLPAGLHLSQTGHRSPAHLHRKWALVAASRHSGVCCAINSNSSTGSLPLGH